MALLAAIDLYLVHLAVGVIVCAVCSRAGDSIRKGHLQPLGSHTPGEGVTVIGKFSSPHVFYGQFVSQEQPIWMRGALDSVNHFGLTNWTDDYLRDNYGEESVSVEPSKLEDRKKKSTTLTMRQFLKLYKTEDLYMVQSLKDSAELEELALIPPSLSCGGFQNIIQDAVLWLGSGRAQSVLHYDSLDNLLCLFDGRKDLVLIDRAYKDAVESRGFVQAGGYSRVNVEKVDMDKFPQFSTIRWKSVKLRAGDCVYIPQGWYHQVTSSTERHLAVNFWFSHLYWFDTADCSSSSTSGNMWSISHKGFASPNEFLRANLLEKLHDKGVMLKYIFLSTLDSSTEERREKFFNAINKYKDAALSWSELYGFDIDKAVLYFPDIFDLPGGTDAVPDDLVLYDTEPQSESVSFENSCDEEGDEEDGDLEEEDDGLEEEEEKRELSQVIDMDKLQHVVDSDGESDDRLRSTDVQSEDLKTTTSTDTSEEETGRTNKGGAEIKDETFKKNDPRDEL